MDKNNRIIEFEYATDTNGEIILHGMEIKNKTNFFSQPFLSSKLDIYLATYDNNEEHNRIVSKISDIKCKMFCLSYKSDLVFQPILHTLR